MSETSRGLVASDKPKIIGPDFFSYYAREVADLLQSEELLSFFPRPTDSESAVKVLENGKGGDRSSAKPLFSDIMADSTSEVKKESLKTLLRECLSTLAQEVDEILDPVIRLHHELSQLKCKKQQLTMEVECKDKPMERPCKMMKAELSSSSHGMSIGDGATKSDPGIQVDEDEDIALDEHILGKQAKKYTLLLHHMEEKLEAILENTISQCRTMTHLEKQELKTYVQKLPPKNLERVAEIMFHSKPSGFPSSDEISVDLENEDNTTLWRLYFYVKAVDNAAKNLSR